MPRPADSDATRESLLSRARRREPNAWPELVDLYGPLVADWCYQCGLDSHAAADCVQDTFASVVKALDRYAAHKANGAFRSWLWRIASNKIKDYLRRTRREAAGAGGSSALRSLQLIPSEALLPDVEPTQPEQLSALFGRALAQLQAEFTARTWDIFQRAVMDQVAVAVVAEEFCITPSAVRQVRSRVLRRLRQQLGDIDS